MEPSTSEPFCVGTTRNHGGMTLAWCNFVQEGLNQPYWAMYEKEKNSCGFTLEREIEACSVSWRWKWNVLVLCSIGFEFGSRGLDRAIVCLGALRWIAMGDFHPIFVRAYKILCMDCTSRTNSRSCLIDTTMSGVGRVKFEED
jgi:hypothetical protein